MNNRFSISDAVKQILATPAPLLLLDTCSLLDIIRQPIRDGIQLNTITSAIRLATRADYNPKDLWVFILSIIMDEIHDNILSVVKDLNIFINQTDNRIMKLNDAFSIIGPFNPILLYQRQHLILQDELKRISSNLLNRAMIIEEDDACMLRAVKRACSNIPPAQKGSQTKDCVIIEHYLELCSRLRSCRLQ